MKTNTSPSPAQLDAGDSNSLVLKVYPAFLEPYINKRVRLKLRFSDAQVQRSVGEHAHLRHPEGRSSDGTGCGLEDRRGLGGGMYMEDGRGMGETAHLVRGMHALILEMKHSTCVAGLPEVTLQEHHGGSRRGARHRRMAATWVDLDHRTPGLTVQGDGFHLTLRPPNTKLTPEDFPDGNGEIPPVVGVYKRRLDTDPSRQLEFTVRLYRWYNAPLSPVQDGSDVTIQ